MNVEIGRYKQINRTERTCEHCSSLGIPNPPIEDENHVLHSCSQGADLRNRFKTKYMTLTSKEPSTNFARIYLEGISPEDRRINSTRQVPSREELFAIHLSTRLMNDINKLMLRRKKEMRINSESK